jgi:hypothetical protein
MKTRPRKLHRQILGWTLAGCIAASVAATEPAAPKMAAPTAERQQLMDLEKEWVTAENKHDTAVLRRILDDRFVATFGAVKTYDKEAFIKLFTGDVDPTESQTSTYDAVIIDRDTAVVVGTDNARGTRAGVAYTAVYRYTVTYIRRDGRWLALAEHIVKAPQAN